MWLYRLNTKVNPNKNKTTNWDDELGHFLQDLLRVLFGSIYPEICHFVNKTSSQRKHNPAKETLSGLLSQLSFLPPPRRKKKH